MGGVTRVGAETGLGREPRDQCVFSRKRLHRREGAVGAAQAILADKMSPRVGTPLRDQAQ